MGRAWTDSKGAAHSIPEGVDVRRNSDGSETVSIRFRFKGAQCRELNLPATAANVKVAAAKLAGVKSAIQLGTFDYVREFPDSKRGRVLSPGTFVSKFTVKEWCEVWLAKHSNSIKATTVDSYRSTLKYWVEAIGSIQISSVTERHIVSAISEMQGCRGSISTSTIAFRMAMQSAKANGEIAETPFRNVDMRSLLREKPKSDYKIIPFTEAEREALYQACKRIAPSAAEMIPFWLWTGLRNEEIFALEWDKHIDLENGIVKVRQVLNRVGQMVDSTKTKSGMRDIPLPAPAIEALKRQKAFTFVRRADQRFVFVNPTTGERWKSSIYPSGYFWERVCKKAEVPYRNMYQLRHTYATTMLDRGEDPRDVARWLGHKDVTLLFQIYGRERVLKNGRGPQEFKNTSWTVAI